MNISRVNVMLVFYLIFSHSAHDEWIDDAGYCSDSSGDAGQHAGVSRRQIQMVDLPAWMKQKMSCYILKLITNQFQPEIVVALDPTPMVKNTMAVVPSLMKLKQYKQTASMPKPMQVNSFRTWVMLNIGSAIMQSAMGPPKRARSAIVAWGRAENTPFWMKNILALYQKFRGVKLTSASVKPKALT